MNKFEGNEYVKGLHGVPDRYKDTTLNEPKHWYWVKGSSKSDNDFVPYTVFEGTYII